MNRHPNSFPVLARATSSSFITDTTALCGVLSNSTASQVADLSQCCSHAHNTVMDAGTMFQYCQVDDTPLQFKTCVSGLLADNITLVTRCNSAADRAGTPAIASAASRSRGSDLMWLTLALMFVFGLQAQTA